MSTDIMNYLVLWRRTTDEKPKDDAMVLGYFPDAIEPDYVIWPCWYRGLGEKAQWFNAEGGTTYPPIFWVPVLEVAATVPEIN